MAFIKLPSNSKKLLDEILQSDNPAEMLRGRLEKASSREEDELCGIIRELIQANYIEVRWADDMPYIVIIHNSARTYDEQLLEYEKQFTNTEKNNVININDNSVKIGDGNKISNSNIVSNRGNDLLEESPKAKRSFFSKHPIVCSLLISLFAGFILLFSFWKDIITFIEGVF